MDIPSLRPEYEDGTGAMVRNLAIPAIALTTALAIGVSVLCLAMGIAHVFQNLFYLPILIMAGYFPKRGIIFTTCVASLYAFLVLVAFGFRNELIAVLVRIAFFELITLVLVKMSSRCARAETELRNQLINLNELVHEQTEYISRELEQSHQLEMAYRNATKYHEMLIGQCGAAICVWNHEEYITHANAAFSELTGIEDVELIGRKIRTVLPLDYHDQGSYPITLTLSARPKDGEARKAQWSISRVFDGERNATVAIIAVGQEIVYNG